jgi:tetratricopeptide (TPR) repeat protein
VTGLAPIEGEQELEEELDQISPEHLHERLRTCDEMCEDAMGQLRGGSPQEAHKRLTAVHRLLEALDRQTFTEEDERAICLCKANLASHLGIYHRRMKSPALAARCHERALRQYRLGGDNLRREVAALLNAAACQQEAGDLEKTLENARAASELGGRLLTSDVGGEPDARPPDNDFAMLSVAYHKVGEAHEGLREWSKASLAYTQAFEVLSQGLGPQHHLTQALERSKRCPKPAALPHWAGRGIGLALAVAPPVAATPRRLPAIQLARARAPPLLETRTIGADCTLTALSFTNGGMTARRTPR